MSSEAQKERKEVWGTKIFEEIWLKFLSLTKNINLYIQEARKTPQKINTEKSMSGHIKPKPLNTKNKGKNLENHPPKRHITSRKTKI